MSLHRGTDFISEDFYLYLGLFLDGISVVVLTVCRDMPNGYKREHRSVMVWYSLFWWWIMSQITPRWLQSICDSRLTGKHSLCSAKAALPFFLSFGVRILFESVIFLNCETIYRPPCRKINTASIIKRQKESNMKIKCDMGEHLARWTMGWRSNYAFVDQANIACGFHAVRT